MSGAAVAAGYAGIVLAMLLLVRMMVEVAVG